MFSGAGTLKITLTVGFGQFGRSPPIPSEAHGWHICDFDSTKAGKVRLIGSLLANILVRNAELLLSSVESFLRCVQVISRYTNPFLPQLKHACNIPQIVRQQNRPQPKMSADWPVNRPSFVHPG